MWVPLAMRHADHAHAHASSMSSSAAFDFVQMGWCRLSMGKPLLRSRPRRNHAPSGFFVVLQRCPVVHGPEGDFRVDLENPVLGFRCYSCIDFMHFAKQHEGLLGKLLAGKSGIDGTSRQVILCIDSIAARHGKHRVASRPQQFSGEAFALSFAVCGKADWHVDRDVCGGSGQRGLEIRDDGSLQRGIRPA